MYRDYSEALLESNQEILKMNELSMEYLKLETYSGITDEARAEQILSEINATLDNQEN